MDIFSLCRSCMKQVVSREIKSFDQKIVDMFIFTTKVMVTQDDKLPKQFCCNCIRKIESTYTYITEVRKVDEILRNLIKNRESIPHENHNILNDVKEETTDEKPILEYIISPKLETLNVSNNIHEYDIKSEKDTKYASLSDNINLEKINTNKCQKPGDEIRKETHSEMQKTIIKKNSIKRNINRKRKGIKLTCNECARDFTVKSTYYRHMASAHTIHKFKCEHCPKTFGLHYDLKSHLACHNEKQFPCPKCGKLFKRQMQLKKHAIAHSDIRPYTCDTCHKRFKFKSVLQNHMKVHSQKKEYLCSVCGINVAQLSNLESHMRVHTGAKPFECSVCEYRAVTSTALKRHSLRHTGVKRHTCQLCHKTFYDKPQLKRHERSHTGELPYKCPHCDRAFIDNWKRKVHLMRQHNFALADIPRMQLDGQAAPPRAT